VTIENPESTTPEDPPLVEPETTKMPRVDPESLDTERILKETGFAAIPAPAMAPEGESDVEARSTPPRAPQPEPAEKVSFNVLAIFSLVLGFALSPLAALFGYIALGQIRRSGQAGENLALTAIVLGWVWLIILSVAGIVLGTLWIQLQ
jgi:hypothetical protein